MRDLNLIEQQQLQALLQEKQLDKHYPVTEFGVKCHQNPDGTKMEYFCVVGYVPKIAKEVVFSNQVVILGDVSIGESAQIGCAVILGDGVVIGKEAIVSGRAYVQNDSYVRPRKTIAVGEVYATAKKVTAA